MPGSNSGRREKENRHNQDGQENQYPGWRIKQFYKIPSWGNFRWKAGEPMDRLITKSRSTGCYFSSWFVATEYSVSDNICFIHFNLIIWLNHHIQYSVPQTFPIQPVHPPRSSSYQPQVKLQFSQLGSMLWIERNFERTSQSKDKTERVPYIHVYTFPLGGKSSQDGG